MSASDWRAVRPTTNAAVVSDADVYRAWDRPMDRSAETYIDEGPIDPKVSGAARAALLAATIDLRLKAPPRLLWFRRARDVIPPQMFRDLVKFDDGTAFRHPEVIGLSHRGEPKAIGVLSTLHPEGASEVAAHEVCHLAGVDAEESALAYGAKVAAALADVLRWFEDRAPAVHEIAFAPGRDIGLLAGVAKPGDLLKAPASHGGGRGAS